MPTKRPRCPICGRRPRNHIRAAGNRRICTDAIACGKKANINARNGGYNYGGRSLRLTAKVPDL